MTRAATVIMVMFRIHWFCARVVPRLACMAGNATCVAPESTAYADMPAAAAIKAARFTAALSSGG